MAMKKVSTNVEYIKWSEVEVDAVLKGFYKETKISEKYKNQIHYVETVDGTLYGLNGSANLDRAVEQIRQGWYIEITYKGTTELKSGNFAGKECHQFELAYDDERVHSFFSGDSKASEDVAYKDDSETKAEEKPAPTLAQPESTPAQEKQPAATQSQAPAQQSEPPKQKKSIF